MRFVCNSCEKSYEIDTRRYICECGGLFNLHKDNLLDKIETPITIGEVVSPLILKRVSDLDLHIKVDYIMPTGSFKDRGAHMLVNHIHNIGIGEVVEDSSGNAAASISAYCAASDIKCNIYISKDTSAGKISQIKSYGANIVYIDGNRDDVADATKVAATEMYYASHVYNPFFFEGTKSIGYEIYNQLGDVSPDWIVCPLGNGTMLIGIAIAFRELNKLYNAKIPKIVAVQSEKCSPIYDMFHNLKPSIKYPTVAEGIAVGKPARAEQIIAMIKETNGTIITVADEEVLNAQGAMFKMGLYCEPSSGAAVAGALKFFNDRRFNGSDMGKIVVPLTGSGLKKG